MKTQIIIMLVLFTQLSIQVFPQESDLNPKIGSNLETGKYAKIDKIQIYYEIYGQGTPLLLIHGGLGSIENFKKCIPTLADHFKVIAIDSPGHGRSSQTDSLSYQFLADQISQFIDFLELDSLYIMGWSDGGVVGLMLANERSDKIKKLIAVGANSRLDGINEEGITWMRNEIIDWSKRDENWFNHYSSLTPEPEKIDRFVRNTQKMWLSEIYISEANLKSIKIPTMIVQGDRDGIKIEHGIELFRNIGKSQLCILPNTSHFVFDERPDLINGIAIDFFSSK
ncbi:MAG: alpha/beta hydrolase [Prolixibacteraceae bacterium]